MLIEIDYNDNFYDLVKKNNGKIVAYGLGVAFRDYRQYLDKIDFYCDRTVEGKKEIVGERVYKPNELADKSECLCIVVFVKGSIAYENIKKNLREMNVSGYITSIFNNISFDIKFPCYISNPRSIKINIVYSQDGWIFGKFADRLQENLQKKGYEVTVSSEPKNDVDINHHIPYMSFQPYPNDTLMITHVDTASKAEMIKKKLQVARLGICMSKETRNKLIAYGIPPYKLCYINPAQDNKILPHKYHIGITHKCRESFDLRKRESALLEVLEGIDNKYFKFTIMGTGWESIVSELRDRDFEVNYYNDFEYKIYNRIMNEIDYYLFMGFDEGSMGYLDALAAGVGTIVTPQGYHLDTDCPIDYPCSTVQQFHEAFVDLQYKKEKKRRAVYSWSWENYTQKHIDIWNYIMKAENLHEIYKNQLKYEDGIFSMLIDDNSL